MRKIPIGLGVTHVPDWTFHMEPPNPLKITIIPWFVASVFISTSWNRVSIVCRGVTGGLNAHPHLFARKKQIHSGKLPTSLFMLFSTTLRGRKSFLINTRIRIQPYNSVEMRWWCKTELRMQSDASKDKLELSKCCNLIGRKVPRVPLNGAQFKFSLRRGVLEIPVQRIPLKTIHSWFFILFPTDLRTTSQPIPYGYGTRCGTIASVVLFV